MGAGEGRILPHPCRTEPFTCTGGIMTSVNLSKLLRAFQWMQRERMKGTRKHNKVASSFFP